MRANEAQLRLLQGQMEPHFLFNTLANVMSLIDADAPRAKHMLEALADYLRASLGGLRHDDSTLGAELDLARRYLELMRARMGERLRFEIDVADDAAATPAAAAGAAAAGRERGQARPGAAGRRRHGARARARVAADRACCRSASRTTATGLAGPRGARAAPSAGRRATATASRSRTCASGCERASARGTRSSTLRPRDAPGTRACLRCRRLVLPPPTSDDAHA